MCTLNLKNNCLTIKDYHPDTADVVIPTGLSSFILQDCTAVPDIEECVTSLTLENCNLHLDLNSMEKLRMLKAIASSVTLFGTAPKKVTCADSLVVCSSGSMNETFLVTDETSYLLSGGSFRELTSLLELRFNTGAEQVESLVKKGVLRLPPVKTLHLPLGWTAPLTDVELVFVTPKHTSVPTGVEHILIGDKKVYISDAPDLKRVTFSYFGLQSHYAICYTYLTKSFVSEGAPGEELCYYGSFCGTKPIDVTPLTTESESYQQLRRQLDCMVRPE